MPSAWRSRPTCPTRWRARERPSSTGAGRRCSTSLRPIEPRKLHARRCLYPFHPGVIFQQNRGKRPHRYRQARARNSLHSRPRGAPEGGRSVRRLCADPVISDAAARSAGQGRAGRKIRQAGERRLCRYLREISRLLSRLGGARAIDSARCRRARRDARDQERALGVQINTHVAGKPLDHPAFEPFYAAMNKLNKPIWLHPARAANFPDYLSEKKSKYEIWWTLGWSYEITAAIARLVFSGMLDKYPNLKIITHHFGGIAPMLEGRIGPGWDQIGARTSDEDLSKGLKSLKKRPLDYFKHEFYTDTAVFGGVPATHAGIAFYDLDKIVFASDCPFDPEQGTMYTRETLRILEGIDMPKADKEKIWHGNLEAITGVKLSN